LGFCMACSKALRGTMLDCSIIFWLWMTSDGLAERA
jgi:hypothetical protein